MFIELQLRDVSRFVNLWRSFSIIINNDVRDVQ